MRLIMGFSLLCLLSNAIALRVIVDTPTAVESKPYLMALDSESNARYQQREENNAKQTIGLPAKSTITAGKVSAFRLEAVVGLPKAAFFVVGDDESSQSWLTRNASFLKEQHAVGFITNIEDEARLQAMRDIADIVLLPVNVDVFAKAIGINHYPFFTDGQEVWQ